MPKPQYAGRVSTDDDKQKKRELSRLREGLCEKRRADEDKISVGSK